MRRNPPGGALIWTVGAAALGIWVLFKLMKTVESVVADREIEEMAPAAQRMAEGAKEAGDVKQILANVSQNIPLTKVPIYVAKV